MNRREFLSAAAIAAGAVSRSWSANDKVNLGIVGVGSRGNNHLGDFIRRQDLNLAAVCDIDTGQTEGPSIATTLPATPSRVPIRTCTSCTTTSPSTR